MRAHRKQASIWDFSDDGALILTYGRPDPSCDVPDGAPKLWSLSRDEPICHLPEMVNWTCMGFTPDSAHLLFKNRQSDRLHTVVVLSTAAGRRVCEASGLWFDPPDAIVREGGRILTIVNYLHALDFDMATGKALGRRDNQPERPRSRARLDPLTTPRGRLIVETLSSAVRVVSAGGADDARPLLELPRGEIRIMPGGKELLYGGEDGSLELWDIATLSRARRFQDPAAFPARDSAELIRRRAAAREESRAAAPAAPSGVTAAELTAIDARVRAECARLRDRAERGLCEVSDLLRLLPGLSTRAKLSLAARLSGSSGPRLPGLPGLPPLPPTVRVNGVLVEGALQVAAFRDESKPDAIVRWVAADGAAVDGALPVEAALACDGSLAAYAYAAMLILHLRSGGDPDGPPSPLPSTKIVRSFVEGPESDPWLRHAVEIADDVREAFLTCGLSPSGSEAAHRQREEWTRRSGRLQFSLWQRPDVRADDYRPRLVVEADGTVELRFVERSRSTTRSFPTSGGRPSFSESCTYDQTTVRFPGGRVEAVEINRRQLAGP